MLEDSGEAGTRFQIGFQVGEIARKIYDRDDCGVLIDAQVDGFNSSFERSAELLHSRQPIFEAGFSAGGALICADILLPEKKGDELIWNMIEVKSSTSVKDYHRDDIAVQAFVAQAAGITLASIALAHIDSSWVYPGNGNYRGLLKENDLSAEAFSRTEEIKAWIDQAQDIVAEPTEPAIEMGDHCNSPFECSFRDYCSRNELKPEYPVY